MLMQNDKLLNLATCARHLGVPIRWLKEKVKKGQIPCLQVNSNKYLFNLEATKTAIAKLAKQEVLREK